MTVTDAKLLCVDKYTNSYNSDLNPARTNQIITIKRQNSISVTL